MQKQIKVKGRIIEYKLRLHARAKSLRLSVYADGQIVVTRPRYISSRLAERMIREKQSWLIDKIDTMSKEKNMPLGSYETDKREAGKLIILRLKYFSELYQLKYQKISVRNQRTRWGSCSRQGNLNFNYRLLHLPSNLRDYIIVHELCHLQEFNHSKKFWELVARAIPDYIKIKKELRGMRM